jgi:uncharacterized protein (DUF1778 family)
MSPTKPAAPRSRDAGRKAPAATPKPRGRGRPSTGKDDNMNIRVDPAARAVWRNAAETKQQRESEFVRQGLDAWASVTLQAHELGMDARTLIDEAIEDRCRVRAALAELRRATLSATEQRVLRILDPADWAKRFGA